METKNCNLCKKDKVVSLDASVSKFYVYKNKKTGKTIIYSFCKECRSERGKALYKASPRAQALARKNFKERQKRNQDYVYELLASKSCVDCGEARIETLDFDHVRGKKKHSISWLIKHGGSLETLKKELEKCEVRCANCHRVKTSKQFKWKKISQPTTTI